MPIDENTLRRGYPKPHPTNTLAHDVARLRAALDGIDAEVVVSDITVAAGAVRVDNLITLTQAQFNAVSSPDARTIYLVPQEQRVYLGAHLVSGEYIGGTYQGSLVYSEIMAVPSPQADDVYIQLDDTPQGNSGDRWVWSGSAWLNVGPPRSSGELTQESVVAVLRGATVDGMIVGESIARLHTITGTTPRINPADGPLQLWTLVGDGAPTFSRPAATPGIARIVTLLIDANGFGVTWPASISWLGGAEPELALNGYAAFTFIQIGGATYGTAGGSSGEAVSQESVAAVGALITVNHGANGATARPASALACYWIGGATPAGAQNGDWWLGDAAVSVRIRGTWVSVAEAPLIGTVTITGGGVYPPGAVVTLSAAAAGNAGDVVWSWEVPPGSGIADSNAAALTFTMSAQTAGTFTVSATSASGSDSPRTAQATLTYAAPTIGTISVSGGGAYLSGETVTLTATRSGNAADMVWSWAVPAGSGVTNSNAATLTFPMTAQRAGTYVVTGDSVLSSDSPRTGQAITTFAAPTIGTVSIAGGGAYEDGETVSLTASRSGNASDIAWSWATPGGSGVVDSGAANLSFTMSEDTAGAYTATATSQAASDSPRNAIANVTLGASGVPAPTIYLPMRTDLLDASGNGYVDNSPNPPSIGPGSGNNGEGQPPLGTGVAVFAGGANQFLQFADVPALNPGTGPWFLSFMARQVPSGVEYPTVISKGAYQSSPGAWSYYVNNSSGFHGIATGNPWVDVVSGPGSTWLGSTWQRVTLSREGDTLTLYSGANTPITASVAGRNFTNTHALRIGADLTGIGGNFFIGQMQDVVYCVGSSLSEAQHTAILAAAYSSL